MCTYLVYNHEGEYTFHARIYDCTERFHLRYITRVQGEKGEPPIKKHMYAYIDKIVLYTR